MWCFGTAFAGDPSVVVAARELPAGTTVSEGDLYGVTFPAEMWALWPSTPFTDPAAVIGRTTTARILQDEVVVPERLGASVRREPAAGRLGLVVAGTGGPSVDLVHPGAKGCAAFSRAPVLRTGAGTLLVEVPADTVSGLVAAPLVAVPAGSGRRACRSDAPPPVPPAPLAEREDTQVTLAARDLPAGAVVGPADVVVAWMPVDLVPASALETVVEGRTLREPVYRGELFREARLTGEPRDVHGELLPLQVLPSLSGAPWWPTDRVAVVDREGCIGAEGAVAATFRTRRADAMAVPAGPDAFVGPLLRALGGTPVSVHEEEVVFTGATAAPAGALVLLPPEGLPSSMCRSPVGRPLAPPSPPGELRIRMGGVSGRVMTETQEPVPDAVVRFGPREGEWVGEVRTDRGGAFDVPGDGRFQTWVRIESPARDPAVFGTAAYADYGVVLYPAGRCTPAPDAADPFRGEPWPLWRNDWDLPDAPGPGWLRLLADGELVHDTLLVSLVERPDGSAAGEIRGEGFGGSARTVELTPGAWRALRERVDASMAKVSPGQSLPDPYPPSCHPGGTTFRVESGAPGAVRHLTRAGALARGSIEEGLVIDVLDAVGLDYTK